MSHELVLGRIIDQVFHYHPGSSSKKGLKVMQQSPYFSDHDLLFVIEVVDLDTNLIITYMYFKESYLAEQQIETRGRSHGS